MTPSKKIVNNTVWLVWVTYPSKPVTGPTYLYHELFRVCSTQEVANSIKAGLDKEHEERGLDPTIYFTYITGRHLM